MAEFWILCGAKLISIITQHAVFPVGLYVWKNLDFLPNTF